MLSRELHLRFVSTLTQLFPTSTTSKDSIRAIHFPTRSHRHTSCASSPLSVPAAVTQRRHHCADYMSCAPATLACPSTPTLTPTHQCHESHVRPCVPSCTAKRVDVLHRYDTSIDTMTLLLCSRYDISCAARKATLFMIRNGSRPDLALQKFYSRRRHREWLVIRLVALPIGREASLAAD